MSSRAINLTDDDFKRTIASGVTLVDFWAPWCGPCKMQGPIVDKIALVMDERAAVAKVNVDEAPGAASELRVRSIPTLVVFKDGEVVEQFVGVQQEAQLVRAIENAL